MTSGIITVTPVVDSCALAAPEQMLLDHLTQSVFLKDQDGRFVAVNQTFCAALGRSRSDILGEDDFSFYPRGLAEKYRADDQRILRDGVTLEVEEQNLQAGQLRTVRVVKSPVRGPDGDIQGVLGIFWDVTEHRQLESQLRQAQKMGAVAQLAGGIAHDFNNLLTGVLGNLALAQMELTRLGEPKTAAIAELLGHAESAGQRAAELTRQLLMFSRRLRPQPEPVALNDCVRDTLATCPLPSSVQLEVFLDPDLGPVRVDVRLIKQVVRHLLLHARDAMPQGGAATLQTQNVTLVPEAAAHRPTPDAKLTVVLPIMHPEARAGEFVRLRVSDTGPGMPPDVLEHVFEPFFSPKGLCQGPGLGLAMAASIAKDHDGWLECHSEPGQGTRFDLYLPNILMPASPGAGGETHSTADAGKSFAL